MKKLISIVAVLIVALSFGGIVRTSIAGRQGVFVARDDGGLFPADVIPVEYIEATDGSQYIDIDYVITFSDTIVSLSCMRTRGDGHAFFGWGSYGIGMNIYLYSGNGCTLSYGRAAYNLWDGNFGGVNEVVNVTFGNGIGTAKNLDRDYSITKELTDFDFSGNTKSFWIFQSNGAGFATQIGLRFYEMWIREGEDIACSIVPVRFVNESGQKEGAVYDLVRQELFTNKGTGYFLIGPDKR